MRKRKSLSEGKSVRNSKLNKNHGIVGVIGSIPFASTNLKLPKNLSSLELHGAWEILPALRKTKDGIVGFRVIRKILPEKFENNLNGKKRRKSA